MKISISECGNASANVGTEVQGKILPKDMPRHGTTAAAKQHLSPLEEGIAVAKAALNDVPDVREDLVEELRLKIQSGEYNVKGEDVADMMMRRRAADQIR